jgi:hypothetical protein
MFTASTTVTQSPLRSETSTESFATRSGFDPKSGDESDVILGPCVGAFEDARASNLLVIDPKKAFGATISPIAITKQATAKNRAATAKYLILAIDYLHKKQTY